MHTAEGSTSSSVASSSGSMPTLHTRASSSSISSLAATFDNVRSSSNSTLSPTTPIEGLSPVHSVARKTSSGSMSGRISPFGGTSNSTSRQLDYGHPHSHPQQGYGAARQQILSSPELEQNEAEDEFLPMNSPFTPGYSMNSPTTNNGSSSTPSPTRRRDSGGPVYAPSNNPSAANGAGFSDTLTAAERREHSRRHSRIHSRNLSVFFPRPEQAGLPGYSVQDHDGSEEVLDDANDHVQVPVAQTRGWGFTNGQNAGAQPGGALGSLGQQQDGQHPTQASSRRGHHHRHSMSHKCVPCAIDYCRLTGPAD